jgi:hypothetical protein
VADKVSKQFERELEIYRSEITEGTLYFYTYLSIHAVAADHRTVHKLLNESPTFWNAILRSLQTSTFITLGRIFDPDPKTHNVDRLLRTAQKKTQIFTKEAFSERRQGTSTDPPEWLTEYLQTLYEPNANDFRRLRSHVSKWRKIYESNYRDLRRKLFAHKEVVEQSEVDTLFAQTKIRELQLLFAFLGSLHEALWQLLNNGRKPILRPRRYSLASMRKRPLPKGWVGTEQEHIVQECEKFLLTIAGITGKTAARKS